MKNPTNRFFYSEEQATLFGENNANEVFDGKEWIKYSEWISKEYINKTSNWDDAKLVYETEDDMPRIKVNPITYEKYKPVEVDK